MDDGQDTSLVAELVGVEDPRPARVLAALRNALSTFLRATGWHRIAAMRCGISASMSLMRSPS
jgi:hypothetical protein